MSFKIILCLVNPYFIDDKFQGGIAFRTIASGRMVLMSPCRAAVETDTENVARRGMDRQSSR